MHFLEELDSEPLWMPDGAQGGLFDGFPALPVSKMPLAPGVVPRDYGLRWYQQEAIDRSLELWKTHQTLLWVMATGTGKTRTFGALTADWGGDVLILAHRTELIDQAARALERLTGELVEVEQGTLYSNKARIVVGSVQSFNKSRLERLGKDRFSLVVADEGHHYLAPSYRRALEFFEAKRLLVTATPDRGDEKALGQIVDEVGYLFDIEQGIEQGYLCPLKSRSVLVEEVDLSGVSSDKDDFVATQLDDAIVKAVEGIVKKTVELYPDSRGPAFFPGVNSAKLACERFNALRPGSAVLVHAKTNKDIRREIVRDFKDGKAQWFCNVGIAGEGFDDPTSDIVIMGRPTKSRSLKAQFIGRGTRVLDGVVDHIKGESGAAARRAAVLASAKPHCTILDFVGAVSPEVLQTPEDVLGGNYTEEEVKLAKRKARENPGGDALENLRKAREELARIARKVQSQVKAQVSAEYDPFKAFGLQRDTESEQRFGHRPATEGQRGALLKLGMQEAELKDVSSRQASRWLDAWAERARKGLADLWQLRALAKHGITERDLTERAAKDALIYLSGTPLSKRDPARLRELLHGGREPGAEG